MKKHVNQILSLALTLALVLAIPFAFTQEVSAASKKTKYVVSSTTTTYSDSTAYTTKYIYFKNGLTKSSTSSSGSKIIYARNKKGDVTSFKFISSNAGNNSYSYYKYEYNKKGLPVKQYEYDEHNKLVATISASFYKNGKTKESVETLPESQTTFIYRYNKKGDPTFMKYSSGDSSTQSSYTYIYDKKGNPIKRVQLLDATYQGEHEKETITTTYKYKYDKKKNIKKAVITEVRVMNDGKTITSSRTITYKYKKVKVAKKFLRFFR